jgi:hypothetical protein
MHRGHAGAGFTAPGPVAGRGLQLGLPFQAYHTALLPLLGFIVLPLTTLVYAVAVNSFGGLQGWALGFVVLALFVDVGSLTGGGVIGRAA